MDVFKQSASTVLLGTVYVGLFLLGLVKIFVYGEASVPEKSRSMQRFWVHRKQADTEMRWESGGGGQQKAEAVARHLRLAVEALGRPGKEVNRVGAIALFRVRKCSPL